MPRDPSDRPIESIIDALVGDLAPVVPVHQSLGIAAGLGATTLAAAVVWSTMGLRADILAGHPAAIVVARGAVLLSGGLCLLLAAVRAAVPGTADHGVSLVGTLLLGLFPLGFMGLLLQSIVSGHAASFAEVGAFGALRCLVMSALSALAVGAAIVVWMRRAAPTDLARAGWLVGWAAAGLGMFAYSLFCPASTPGFVTTVYPVAMLLVALVFRLAVPQLVRW